MDLEPVFVTVIPEPGLSKEVAKRLLSVAEHPYQVRTVTYPQFGFEVPGHVFLRFEELGPMGEPEPETPKVFVDGDTDQGALEKRERVKRARKATAPKAEEEKK